MISGIQGLLIKHADCHFNRYKSQGFKAQKDKLVYWRYATRPSDPKLLWNILRWTEEWYFIWGPSPTPKRMFCAEVKRFATTTMLSAGQLTAQELDSSPANLLARFWVHVYVHRGRKIKGALSTAQLMKWDAVL